jgi:DNA-directed RNA polymerase specialized sigma24 family protein
VGLDELTQIQIGSSVLVAGAQNGDSKFYSWLYRIAFNRGVNFYRSVRVWDEIYDEYPDTAVTANPERVLIGIEKERKVLKCQSLMVIFMHSMSDG